MRMWRHGTFCCFRDAPRFEAARCLRRRRYGGIVRVPGSDRSTLREIIISFAQENNIGNEVDGDNNIEGASRRDSHLV